MVTGTYVPCQNVVLVDYIHMVPDNSVTRFVLFEPWGYQVFLAHWGPAFPHVSLYFSSLYKKKCLMLGHKKEKGRKGRGYTCHKQNIATGTNFNKKKLPIFKCPGTVRWYLAVLHWIRFNSTKLIFWNVKFVIISSDLLFNCPDVSPTIEQIDQSFGATRPGVFEPERQIFTLTFRGLAFQFPADTKFQVWDFYLYLFSLLSYWYGTYLIGISLMRVP